MYSYEDKIRAVELYNKLGKRVKATVRQLVTRGRVRLFRQFSFE
jgi:hypothetical protein